MHERVERRTYVDLPTYTNIWRIEKRLYKLYDLRLPMPLPIVWIGVFVGVLVPWSLLLVLVGVPVQMPWHVLFLVPPGIVTWLATRPVIEGKRLTELLESQLRYLGEPKAWYRLAPGSEPDTVTFSGRVWRTTHARAKSKAPRKARHPQRRRERVTGPRQVRPAVAAAAAAAAQAPVAEPASSRTGWGSRRGTAPALRARVGAESAPAVPGGPAGAARREEGLSGGSGRSGEGLAGPAKGGSVKAAPAKGGERAPGDAGARELRPLVAFRPDAPARTRPPSADHPDAAVAARKGGDAERRVAGRGGGDAERRVAGRGGGDAERRVAGRGGGDAERGFAGRGRDEADREVAAHESDAGPGAVSGAGPGAREQGSAGRGRKRGRRAQDVRAAEEMPRGAVAPDGTSPVAADAEAVARGAVHAEGSAAGVVPAEGISFRVAGAEGAGSPAADAEGAPFGAVDAEAAAAREVGVPIKTAESRRPAAGKPIDTEALRRLRRLAASADAPNEAAPPAGNARGGEPYDEEVARDQHRKGQPPRLSPALALSATQQLWPPLNPDAKPLPRPATRPSTERRGPVDAADAVDVTGTSRDAPEPRPADAGRTTEHPIDDREVSHGASGPAGDGGAADRSPAGQEASQVGPAAGSTDDDRDEAVPAVRGEGDSAGADAEPGAGAAEVREIGRRGRVPAARRRAVEGAAAEPARSENGASERVVPSRDAPAETRGSAERSVEGEGVDERPGDRRRSDERSVEQGRADERSAERGPSEEAAGERRGADGRLVGLRGAGD
ncbi:hypothetical protein E1286_31530, partial [Nonomuraea terrae]